jgi:hypothetical protein
MQEPLRVYELRGPGAARTPLDVALTRGLSRFVGRDEELRTLEAALGKLGPGERAQGVVELCRAARSLTSLRTASGKCLPITAAVWSSPLASSGRRSMRRVNPSRMAGDPHSSAATGRLSSAVRNRTSQVRILSGPFQANPRAACKARVGVAPTLVVVGATSLKRSSVGRFRPDRRHPG